MDSFKLNMNSIIPVGTIMAFPDSEPRPDYLKCDGSTYLISDYPKLAITPIVRIIDERHFSVPDLTDGRYLKGGTSAGAIEDAGLPNITGHTSTIQAGGDLYYANGAIYVQSSGGGSGGSGPYNFAVYGFDASRSSAIYGKSDTVTPVNMSVVWHIKAK